MPEAQGQYAAHFAGFGSGLAGGIIGVLSSPDFRGSKALKGSARQWELPKDATGHLQLCGVRRGLVEN